MALTQSQRAIIEKARSLGGGQQAIALTDADCTYLVSVIASDLGRLSLFPEFEAPVRPLFSAAGASDIPGDFLKAFERLVSLAPDSDTYFWCLAALYRARMKYERILETQMVPTIDQVGPRALLQYGGMSVKSLAGFLLWRKWMYDIDNRAAQETGYLFEPIIAGALGGVPASARKSPIRRQSDKRKGRQVDCIRGKSAYEIKLRVTIAASGQGRWKEELAFPIDCQASGYTPVLVVLDPTVNPKLEELKCAFLAEGGDVYVGDDAWKHLEATAGVTMGLFLTKYVHEPIAALLAEAPERLPELWLRMGDAALTVSVGGEKFSVKRKGDEFSSDDDSNEGPDDPDAPIPGL
jgi:hypothetical protein